MNKVNVAFRTLATRNSTFIFRQQLFFWADFRVQC